MESQILPPKNIRFKVEKPIQTFTGRELFLEDLHKFVKESQVKVPTQAPFSVVAATGGIGKTETLRMYIQLHAKEYDHVIWIDAEDNSSAKNQFIQLAIKLNISTDFGGKQKEFEIIRDQIFDKLLQHKNVVLLVFDNAEAFDDDQDLKLNGIRCLLPKSLSPSFVEPTVIVTSRNQNWNLQNVVRLDLWTAAEVVVFVVERLGLEKEHENYELAAQLGNLFGRLPIALQAAVAVIGQQTKRRKKYGIQNLIDEYQNGSRKVLAQKPLDANMRLTHMSDTMLILWNISFEKIVKFPDGELAIKILCFMAFLSPTRIPYEFLFALLQTDFTQDSFKNALEILEDHSLIASFESADSASRSFSIHRMIQDATIENLRSNEEPEPRVIFNHKTFLNETQVLLKLSVQSTKYIKTLDTRGLSRGGEIVENLVRITDHVSKDLNVKEFRDLTVQVAGVLRKTNEFATSIELYKKVLKATSASEDETEIRYNIELKWDLALAYGDGGFHQKSIELYEEVLEDDSRAFGQHYKKTLQAKGTIASALRRLGKYDEAAAKFSEVLQDFQNNQDTQSESFLTTKHNYALLLIDQGKNEEALKLFTEVLEEKEKNPDLKSEDVISTKGNIALLLGEQRKFEEASAMMLQNISDATRVFGPFHLTTLGFKRYYARLLGDEGKHEEAASLLLELLEIQETELGSEHPSTLHTKNDLAALYIKTKEFDEALPLLDVEVYEKVFGPEHPDTMTAANNFAIVMGQQGKHKEAISLLYKILKIHTQVLGPNHIVTLSMMYNIGATHYRMKEFDKAAEVFQDVLLLFEEVLGESHPLTMKTLELLTCCRKILDERKDLIVNFVTLTLVDAEIGRNILEASNWKMEAALDTFFN